MDASTAKIAAEGIFEAVGRQCSLLRSFVGAGSGASGRDFDLYVLIDDSFNVSAEGAAVTLHTIESSIRQLFAAAQIDRAQPFILTRREFLYGPRASMNGIRTIDQAIAAERSNPDAIMTDEEDVLDDDDYTLVKAAWTFLTAYDLAGCPCGDDIIACRDTFGVSRDGASSWVRLCLLMSMIGRKRYQKSASASLLNKALSKNVIRMAYSCCVEQHRKKSGTVTPSGVRLLYPSTEPNVLGFLRCSGVASHSMDSRYALALREFAKIGSLWDQKMTEALHIADQIRNHGVTSSSSQHMCSMIEAIDTLHTWFTNHP